MIQPTGSSNISTSQPQRMSATASSASQTSATASSSQSTSTQQASSSSWDAGAIWSYAKHYIGTPAAAVAVGVGLFSAGLWAYKNPQETKDLAETYIEKDKPRGGTGFNVKGGSNIRIDNCTAKNCETGFNVDGTTDASITNSTAK